MTENYNGPIAFDASGDTVYLELTIDDLDSPNWVGQGHDVPGATAIGAYEVKLIDNDHGRRGQTATGEIEREVEDDGVLRFAGRTAFE